MGLWSVASVEHNARMPLYTQTDLNLGHSFKVSKTNEAMRLGFEVNAANILNQHAILAVSPNPFGRGNEWLAFSDSSALRTNVPKFLPGYDVAPEANPHGCMVRKTSYNTPI